jgi:uncharacterized protein
MNKKLKNKLLKITKKEISDKDVSHDFHHTRRVLKNAETISQQEGGDLDIITPSALFHDIIVYPKHSTKSHKSHEDSANKTEKVLLELDNYPKEKIDKVKTCIKECSFSKNLEPSFLESAILQDADGLEATGAVSIMRTFASTGQMKRPFYNPQDPFCENREPNPEKFALDLFYNRLLKVSERMNTETAKEMAKRRTKFLENFLDEVKLELKESSEI